MSAVPEDPPVQDRARSPRTQFFLACAVGGLLATVVFTWMVSVGGRGLLTREEPLGRIYDAQARSLLHGHWDIPAEPLSFERFNIDGEYFTYFGPWPAVLRMPVVAVTDELDGRLGRVSLLLAFVVLLVFVARLAWQVRSVVRGVDAPTRLTLIAAGGFMLLVGCGSTALFLASRAWVYHEAIAWGMAWAVASFSFLLSYLLDPRGRALAWACVTAILAVLSRPVVGAGPVIALGILLALGIVQQVAARRQRSADGDPPTGLLAPARWLGVSDLVTRRPLWTVAVATAAPVVSYAYVNHAKFGTLVGLPYEKQDLLLSIPGAALAPAGRLFSLSYAPTNLLQYVRPDGFAVDRLFPWVAFSRPTTIGDYPADGIAPSTSITAISIALVVLAVVGLVAIIRAAPGAQGDATAAVLRLPVLAAVLATTGVVLVGVLAQRYEGDVVPVLVLAGAAGLFWLPALLTERRRRARVTVAVVLVVAAAWSCLATFALTLSYQRQLVPFQDTEVRADFVNTQLDVNDSLGLGPPDDIRHGRELPQLEGRSADRTDAPLGRFFVVGDCKALYVSDGSTWQPIEIREQRGDAPTCERLVRAERDG